MEKKLLATFRPNLRRWIGILSVLWFGTVACALEAPALAQPYASGTASPGGVGVLPELLTGSDIGTVQAHPAYSGTAACETVFDGVVEVAFAGNTLYAVPVCFLCEPHKTQIGFLHVDKDGSVTIVADVLPYRSTRAMDSETGIGDLQIPLGAPNTGPQSGVIVLPGEQRPDYRMDREFLVASQFPSFANRSSIALKVAFDDWEAVSVDGPLSLGRLSGQWAKGTGRLQKAEQADSRPLRR